MNHDTPELTPPPKLTGARRRRGLLLLLAALPLLAVVVGGVGLLHPAATVTPGRTVGMTRQPSAALPRQTDGAGCSSGGIGRLAGLLFDWDAATSSRQDVVRRIAQAADPSGIETPGLLSDLDGYLPSEDAWAVLAGYRTRQTLTGVRSLTPDSWPAITANNHARLPASVAAFTIDGSRRRAGTVDGARSTFADQVSFTMILSCPAGGGWRLLRLSRLGEPLP